MYNSLPLKPVLSFILSVQIPQVFSSYGSSGKFSIAALIIFFSILKSSILKVLSITSIQLFTSLKNVMLFLANIQTFSLNVLFTLKLNLEEISK